jgi:hypothetical protein
VSDRLHDIEAQARRLIGAPKPQTKPVNQNCPRCNVRPGQEHKCYCRQFGTKHK